MSLSLVTRDAMIGTARIAPRAGEPPMNVRTTWAACTATGHRPGADEPVFHET
jgi:hypothetical protein